MDGAKGLRENLERLFPRAIVTLDVCHVVEKLWDLGHRFHKEGSQELTAWSVFCMVLFGAGSRCVVPSGGACA